MALCPFFLTNHTPLFPIAVDKQTFFERIALLNLGGEQKGEIAEQIIRDVNSGKLYWLEIALSAAIATMGLLTNSVAVVIGAMLIAPLLRPIQAIAFSIATGNKNLYYDSFRLLVRSVLVSIVIAALLTYLVPFSRLTPEIIARTNPTLIDLFIAIASGIVAIASLGFQRLSASIAGVAMAAALLPPICVVGIGLAMWSPDIAWGSFLLFLTNLVAIVMVGITVFFLFGFSPNNQADKKYAVSRMILIILSGVIICVPLVVSMRNIATDLSLKSKVESSLQNALQTLDDDIEIQSITSRRGQEMVSVSLTIRVPQSFRIPEATKREISRQISQRINASVDLEIYMIPRVSVLVEKDPEPSPEQVLEESLDQFLSERYPNISLVRFAFSQRETPLLEITVSSSGDRDETEFQRDVMAYMREQIGEDFVLLIDWPSLIASDQIAEDIDEQEQEIRALFDEWVPSADVELFRATTQVVQEGDSAPEEKIHIFVRFETSEPQIKIRRQLEWWKENLETEFEIGVVIEPQVIFIRTWDL